MRRKIEGPRSARILVVVENERGKRMLGNPVQPTGPGVYYEHGAVRSGQQFVELAGLYAEERSRLDGVLHSSERADGAGSAGDAISIVVIDDPPLPTMGEQELSGVEELLPVRRCGDQALRARGHHSTWRTAVAAV